MNTSKKTKNSLIAILVVAVVLIAGVWYMLNSQKTSLEVTADSQAYFMNDNPVVSVNLLNAGNANSGELRVSYDDSVLELQKSENSEGVVMKELKNTLVFELSESYFDAKDIKVADLTFSILKAGKTKVVAEEESNLSGDKEIEEYVSAVFNVGVLTTTPEVEEVRNEGNVNSI